MSWPDWLTPTHVAFAVIIPTLLGIDLATHRSGRQTSPRAAAWWSVIWIGAGLAFSIPMFASGAQRGHEYLAAYAMEKSLSLDNMFVFLLIFRSLNIPDERQHEPLFWGIFGALVLRAIFITAGVSALEQWTWIRYAFGGLLIVAAIHSWRHRFVVGGKTPRPLQWMARHLPVTQDASGSRFVVRVDGHRKVTPLLLALLAIELSDVVFAIDSVPAALSVSRDRFVVYASNAFAILGLRSLYLAMHGYLEGLRYLHFGLAAVLAFAGVKLMLGEHLALHPLISVAIIAVCIGVSAVASVWAARSSARAGSPSESARSSQGS